MSHFSPSVKNSAFSCPHCEVYARQEWYLAYAHEMEKDELPYILTDADLPRYALNELSSEEDLDHMAWAERKASGQPFFDFQIRHCEIAAHNFWFSRCFNCNKLGLWICDRMIYPQRSNVPAPNPDMPEDIRRDYEEASTILDLSPRGAAALLRLAIDKLCGHLGDPKKSIYDNIKIFVENGLDSRIQKAMDTIRVIGNNAVHPGQIDLKDDRATAVSQFQLLNLIVERLISQPKHVDKLYAALPESAREAIEKRDGKPKQ